MKVVIYQVHFINGYIGGKDRVVAEFDNATDAKAVAARCRKTLSRGERSYFKCSYKVVKITKKM